jgi:hypothetical protein
MRDSGSSETDNINLNLGLAEHPSAPIKYPSSQLHFPSFTTALAMQVKQASFEQEVLDKGKDFTLGVLQEGALFRVPTVFRPWDFIRVLARCAG